MITFSGRISPFWPSAAWSSCISSSGWYAPPSKEGSAEVQRLRGKPQQQLCKVIQMKLVVYKRQDAAKRLRFNLKVDHILELNEAKLCR
ncbi:MAG: hypothetical protein AB2697_06085 [Candidatus Thiodiazotropha endolucinida]